MTKIILRLKIRETGKTIETQTVVLENTTPLLFTTEYFLDRHLSICLREGSDQPNTIIFYSRESSHHYFEQYTNYFYYRNGRSELLPKEGYKEYILKKGDTFSASKKTYDETVRNIEGEVLFIDSKPHEDSTFPEEFHVSP